MRACACGSSNLAGRGSGIPGITANGVWRLLKANHLELDVEASNVAKMHMVTPESLERLVERRRDYM